MGAGSLVGKRGENRRFRRRFYGVADACSDGLGRPAPALADEGLDGFLAEPDRPAVLDPRRVTLISVKGVLGAPEFVGGLLYRQEPVAAGGSTEGEEECDDLGE